MLKKKEAIDKFHKGNVSEIWKTNSTGFVESPKETTTTTTEEANTLCPSLFLYRNITSKKVIKSPRRILRNDFMTGMISTQQNLDPSLQIENCYMAYLQN